MQHAFNLDPDPFVPPGHYVPVLQDHVGERRALLQLRLETPEVLDRCMPMVQILGGDSTKLSEGAIKNHVKQLALCLGTHLPFYLDFVREDPARAVETKKGKKTVGDIAYAAAVKRGLAFVPVAWSWAGASQLDRAANAALAHHRGMGLRHPFMRSSTPAGVKETDIVASAVRDSHLRYEEIDLLLDMGFIGPNTKIPARRIERTVRKFLALGPWRRVVLIGSSIPSALSEVKENSVGKLERKEWATWTALPKDLRRVVAFGDYGVQHPDPPQDAPQALGMRANIRYAIDKVHLVARGKGAVRQEGPAQYQDLCKWLAKHDDFDGRGASCGDNTILDCAAGTIPPRHQDMWRQAGSARHLTFVSAQVQASR